MFALKLKKMGKGIGITLPNEMLCHLKAEAGQTIFAIEKPNGFVLTRLDPDVRAQVEIGEEFLDRQREVLAKLAKR